MLFKKINNMHLWKKIMLSHFIVLALSLTMLGILVLVYFSSFVREEIIQSFSETIEQSKGNLLSQIKDIENAVFSLHSDSTVQSILRKPTPSDDISIANDLEILEGKILSLNIFGKYPIEVSIFAFDKYLYPTIPGIGRVFSSSVSDDEKWFKETVVRNGQMYWKDSFSSPDLASSKVSASRLIVDVIDREKSLGVIKATVDSRLFLDVIDKIKLGKTGKVFLVQNDKIVIVKSNTLLSNLNNSSDFFQAIHTSGEGSFFKSFDRTNYLVIYDEIESTGWKLVGVVPAKEIYADIGIIRNSTFFTWLFSLFIAFLCSVFISIKITKPIYSLANNMKYFQSELDMRVSTDSRDEIGILYESFNKMMGRINKLIDEVNEKSRKEKEAEFKALQAQIHPHFLYNTLDSINWLALRYNANDISLMVTSLGNFLRHSLNKGKELISIANELEQVKSYIAIQKIRFKDKFDVQFNLEPEVHAYTIAKLTLQPLIENCLNHGFKDIDYNGFIRVEGRKEGDFIFLKVADNGAGTDVDALNKSLAAHQIAEIVSDKYGINNVNDRIKLHFGSDCGLSYEDNEYGGLTAVLVLRALEYNNLNNGKEV